MPKFKNEPRQPRFANYKPLSEREEDAINRMTEREDLMVEIEGWGYHVNPDISVGDKRIQIKLNMEFTRPKGIEANVKQFHLKLKMRDGRVLAESIESTIQNYQPLKVTAGRQVGMVWDLAIDEVPDDVIGTVIPETRGEKQASIDGDEVIYHEGEEGNDASTEDEETSPDEQEE